MLPFLRCNRYKKQAWQIIGRSWKSIAFFCLMEIKIQCSETGLTGLTRARNCGKRMPKIASMIWCKFFIVNQGLFKEIFLLKRLLALNCLLKLKKYYNNTSFFNWKSVIYKKSTSIDTQQACRQQFS